MVRVQTEKFRDVLMDEVMDPQYEQFGPGSGSAFGEHTMVPRTGLRRIIFYASYWVLLLLLLVLLMVTGIKFTQLNKEVTDVKILLERISNSRLQHSGPVKPVSLDAITPVRGTCREGWVSYKRSCYLLSTTTITWGKAEQQCKTLGGHLVVLNNVEELDFISQIVEIQYDYWIGLVEREHEGHWSWVDGTDFDSTQTYWDEGQPDNWDYRENGEDCGQLHSSENRKRKMWNDADCSIGYRFICEMAA